MIKEKDVIRMKVPYPTIDSKLAYMSHMYICYKELNSDYKFLKCQTLKPYMLGSKNPTNNYLDEYPNINRNPFERPTRIDCDKLFNTKQVCYSEKLLTNIRKDICIELYQNLEYTVNNIDIYIVKINEEKLVLLNEFINFK